MQVTKHENDTRTLTLEKDGGREFRYEGWDCWNTETGMRCVPWRCSVIMGCATAARWWWLGDRDVGMAPPSSALHGSETGADKFVSAGTLRRLGHLGHLGRPYALYAQTRVCETGVNQ